MFGSLHSHAAADMGDPLGADKRAALFSEVHVGILGVSRRVPTPLVVPVWYLYEDEMVRLIVLAGSLKHRVLVNSGFASLCVQEEILPYRYATVEGRVAIREVPADFIPRLAVRYLGPEVGARYAPQIRPEANVLVEIEPHRWLSDEYSFGYFGILPT